MCNLLVVRFLLYTLSFSCKRILLHKFFSLKRKTGRIQTKLLTYAFFHEFFCILWENLEILNKDWFYQEKKIIIFLKDIYFGFRKTYADLLSPTPLENICKTLKNLATVNDLDTYQRLLTNANSICDRALITVSLY